MSPICWPLTRSWLWLRPDQNLPRAKVLGVCLCASGKTGPEAEKPGGTSCCQQRAMLPHFRPHQALPTWTPSLDAALCSLSGDQEPSVVYPLHAGEKQNQVPGTLGCQQVKFSYLQEMTALLDGGSQVNLAGSPGPTLHRERAPPLCSGLSTSLVEYCGVGCRTGRTGNGVGRRPGY